jgi:signal transduction histidine kinase
MDMGLRSFMSLPLLVEGELIGVLAVSARQIDAFNDEAIDIARQFADQITIAIQQARLHEQMGRLVERLQIQHNIDQAILRAQSREEIGRAAIRYIRQLVPCDRAGLSIYDLENSVAHVIAMDVDGDQPLPPQQFPLTNAVGLEVMQRGETLYIEDFAQFESPSLLIELQLRYGMRSGIVIPLIAEGGILGALSLSSSQVAAFTDEARSTARQIADQVAVAILQTRLNEQIRAHADELEQRVAARTAELATANERLRELDALKSKFVSDVSHELRTPVAGLNTRLYLLERSQPGDYAKHIGILKEQIVGLNKLIESILDLSRIDLAARDKLEFAPVDLNMVVTQVCLAYEAMAQMAGLELILCLENAVPPVWGERNQISQVVTNLVANAINYTPAGTVKLATWYEPEGQQAFLSVQDTGMGIEDEDLPHIFERFYRGSRAGQSNIRGTGLGLGIVKEIIDLHNGSIAVQSVVNQGSTFTVSFPTVSI